MSFGPKSVGCYSLAQTAEVWLWFSLYWAYLLVGTLSLGGWDVTFWRAVLAAWILVGFFGLLLLRRIAHTARKYAWNQRKIAGAVGEICVELTDEYYILYGLPYYLKERSKRILVVFLVVLLWIFYIVTGFLVCSIRYRGQDLLGREAMERLSTFDATVRCWDESTALHAYLAAGTLLAIHMLAFLLFRQLRERMDRFVFGPCNSV